MSEYADRGAATCATKSASAAIRWTKKVSKCAKATWYRQAARAECLIDCAQQGQHTIGRRRRSKETGGRVASRSYTGGVEGLCTGSSADEPPCLALRKVSCFCGL